MNCGNDVSSLRGVPELRERSGLCRLGEDLEFDAGPYVVSAIFTFVGLVALEVCKVVGGDVLEGAADG